MLDTSDIVSEMSEIEKGIIPNYRELLQAASRDRIISMATIGNSKSTGEMVPISCNCKGSCRSRSCRCVKAEVQCTQYCGHGENGCDNLGTILEST